MNIPLQAGGLKPAGAEEGGASLPHPPPKRGSESAFSTSPRSVATLSSPTPRAKAAEVLLEVVCFKAEARFPSPLRFPRAFVE